MLTSWSRVITHVIRSARNRCVSIERTATGRYVPERTSRAEPNASSRPVLFIGSFALPQNARREDTRPAAPRSVNACRIHTVIGPVSLPNLTGSCRPSRQHGRDSVRVRSRLAVQYAIACFVYDADSGLRNRHIQANITGYLPSSSRGDDRLSWEAPPLITPCAHSVRSWRFPKSAGCLCCDDRIVRVIGTSTALGQRWAETTPRTARASRTSPARLARGLRRESQASCRRLRPGRFRRGSAHFPERRSETLRHLRRIAAIVLGGGDVKRGFDPGRTPVRNVRLVGCDPADAGTENLLRAPVGSLDQVGMQSVGVVGGWGMFNRQGRAAE